MSPPAKTPGRPVIRSSPDAHEAVLDHDALGALEQAEGRSPGRARARASRPRAPRARRSAAGSPPSSSSILSSSERAAVGVPDGREPLDDDALGERLLELGVVRGHPVAGAAVDDDGLLGAEALGRAGGVEGGVAAAVDGDAAAEQRRLLALHAAQQRDGVEHLGGAAGGDVGALAEVGADGDEGGVEAPSRMTPASSSTGGRASASRRGRGCAGPRRRGCRAGAGSAGCRSASCRRRTGPASWISTVWPSSARW